MQIYNTLTRKKEEFIPQKEGEYRIYVCGPTVYNYIHIGNARPVVVFDTLRRYLEYRGNKVYFVSNITDIDDKLIQKAQEQGCSMKEVAEKFEAEFIKDSDGLNAKTPTVRPRATEHIEEILDIVKDILDKGYGYVAKNGDVYFRTRAFKEYGKLSHLNLEELESGNRELRSQMDDDLKEDPADFAVWKAAKPGEPAWPSPYGPGRPGWHIECSAMARKHLGKTIDLHCGGQDLIFPHHENEIAQSECANGCTFSRYWMHNGFLNIDNHKMSKSANNFFTVREIAEVFGYEPIRYFLLTAGYRMPLNYTVELLNSCKASLERLYTCRDNLDFLIKNAKGESNLLAEKAAAAKVKFNTAMDDDLNTPDALAAVFELVKDINTLGADASVDALKAAAATFDELTGVLGLLYNRKTDEIPAEVMDLVNQRAEAKKAKDWPTADALRAKITEMGYVVEDTPQGPKVTRA
ncbi:cysteine--tRNA ligase [Candidatus Allofournierella excrementavium]|uniref:cysteine--tRNA ligase n=1 Tax=Candidatus Allofournierella excrementavium TaxID=2838591 RepID=UPI003AB11D5F